MPTTTIADRAGARQGEPDSRVDEPQGNELSLVLALLREAIDESGWKHEALAVEMRLPNAAYLSRMLSGEKPWTLRHLLALPNDIEKRFAEKWARHRGAVVVAPLAGDAAVAALVGGLVGVLTGAALPIRMAKATLPPAAVRRAR